ISGSSRPTGAERPTRGTMEHLARKPLKSGKTSVRGETRGRASPNNPAYQRGVRGGRGPGPVSRPNRGGHPFVLRLTRVPPCQYASALRTSPPLIDPSAIQVAPLIESLMKRTDPSPNRVFTPPGCRLRVPAKE